MGLESRAMSGVRSVPEILERALPEFVADFFAAKCAIQLRYSLPGSGGRMSHMKFRMNRQRAEYPVIPMGLGSMKVVRLRRQSRELRLRQSVRRSEVEREQER